MILLIKRRWLIAGTAVVLAAVTLLCVRNVPSKEAFSALSDTRRPVVILDAGHGGEDGGAVSADGVAESQINLKIVQKTDLLLTFLGRDTLLTRSGEDAVYSPEAKTLREKKVSDLKNRVAMVNAAEDAVLISVHQNSLPVHPAVHGAQVFYNTILPADQMAQTIQSTLNGLINPGNDKAAKAIDGTIYLMKEITRPGILVECGFLSNQKETQQLQSDDYQSKLALAIVSGYLEYETNKG
ncbi:MAG: N-acetylmuramoyl-L-alanine amidase [Clostridiales bacterium]|nr:N-acetylmuramoyl-L-alanine amidase [Candidatus Cacconaster stercorequi]